MFVDAGFDTTLLCWDRDGESPKREQRAGYRIVRCSIRAPYGSKWLFLLMPLWMLYAFFFLLRTKSDVIHACDFDAALPALPVKLFRHVNVVYDIYDFYTAKSGTVPRALKGLFSVAERFCARRADAVIIVDESRKYLLGKTLPKRLLVAMNCPYDEVEPSWEKPDSDVLTIFYPGVIARYRGIRKLARVTDNLPGVHVVLAGRITEDAYAKLLEQTPQFEYIGIIDYKEALRRTYEADAVYAYYDPALEINRTANSCKMYDAFMCSTAVLVNSEPPSARIVAERECGSCLPYDDDEHLRETLLRWRDGRALVRQLGANGRELFEERFNWEQIAEDILETYRELGLG